MTRLSTWLRAVGLGLILGCPWSGVVVAQMPEAVQAAPTPEPQNLLETQPDLVKNPNADAVYVIGCPDQKTWCYLEIELPESLKDVDGGTIRLIMQHELSNVDEVRVIDIAVATENDDPAYGSGHHQEGRYVWMAISGTWTTSAASLGDNARENLAGPLGWVWIVDYKWLEGDDLLGGDRIRIYSHPDVTTRMIVFD
jgi:hypothetical protein